MSKIVAVHMMQSLPPGVWVRDDNNEPKMNPFGGVNRHYLSSQNQKRAIRKDSSYKESTDCETYRTKCLGSLIYQKMIEKGLNDISEEQVCKDVNESLSGVDGKNPNKSQVLEFISEHEVNAIVELLSDADNKEHQKSIKNLFKKNEVCNSVDQSVFGRMMASLTPATIRGACQLAPAIATHATEMSFDFFSAMDDLETSHAGGGHVDYIPFTTATMYRYANINTTLLAENLKDNPAKRDKIMPISKAFVKSFIYAQPGAKMNSMFSMVLPDFVIIEFHNDDHHYSLANAFESPVPRDSEKGFLIPSIQRLMERRQRYHRAWDNGDNKIESVIFSTYAADELGLKDTPIYDNIAAALNNILPEG